eukprot:5896453-Karenia_brevis.AAC.1
MVHVDTDDKPTALDDVSIPDAKVVHCDTPNKSTALNDDETSLDEVEDDIVDELQNAHDGGRAISFLCEITGHSPST